MTCLLCPAIAVADRLCVPCGAKRWWADIVTIIVRERPALALVDFGSMVNGPKSLDDVERFNASKALPTIDACHDFLAALESARANRLADEAQKNRGKEL